LPSLWSYSSPVLEYWKDSSSRLDCESPHLKWALGMEASNWCNRPAPPYVRSKAAAEGTSVEPNFGLKGW
jgi:hypothetical protein